MKILIIEDRPEHLREMQAELIRHDFEVYPDVKVHEQLNEAIIRCFEPGNEVFFIKEAKEYIFGMIAEVDPDLVLVDFELKEGTNSVIGTRFIEMFLEDRNIIIVTGQTDTMLNNTIMATIDKDRSRRDVCFKGESMGMEFLKLLMEKIKKFVPAENKAPKFRK